MKAGWDRKQLSELLQKTGSIDPTKEPQAAFTYIDVSSVSNETFSITETSDILGKDAPSRARRGVRAGDVIFATIRPTLKRVAIIPDELDHSVCSTGYFVLRSGAKINNRFLFYWLFSDEFEAEMEARQKGASYPAVNDSDIRDQFMPVPPLDEQRRIVAVLDKAFAGIATATANTQKNLTNARAVFESYMQAIFARREEGWTKYSFEQICSISSKLVDPRLPAYLNLPHIGAGNMESRTGGIIDVLTAREEGLKSGKFLFDASMVLYSKIRPYLMKACRPEFSGLCSADVYPLVPKAGLLDRDMLFHILISDEFTAYAEAGSARAGMPKVNREHLFKYSVWLPDVATQKIICRKLDDLSSKCQDLANIAQSKLTALAELKQSLLQKAFAGELT